MKTFNNFNDFKRTLNVDFTIESNDRKMWKNRLLRLCVLLAIFLTETGKRAVNNNYILAIPSYHQIQFGFYLSPFSRIRIQRKNVIVIYLQFYIYI